MRWVESLLVRGLEPMLHRVRMCGESPRMRRESLLRRPETTAVGMRRLEIHPRRLRGIVLRRGRSGWIERSEIHRGFLGPRLEMRFPPGSAQVNHLGTLSRTESETRTGRSKVSMPSKGPPIDLRERWEWGRSASVPKGLVSVVLLLKVPKGSLGGLLSALRRRRGRAGRKLHEPVSNLRRVRMRRHVAYLPKLLRPAGLDARPKASPLFKRATRASTQAETDLVAGARSGPHMRRVRWAVVRVKLRGRRCRRLGFDLRQRDQPRKRTTIAKEGTDLHVGLWRNDIRLVLRGLGGGGSLRGGVRVAPRPARAFGGGNHVGMQAREVAHHAFILFGLPTMRCQKGRQHAGLGTPTGRAITRRQT